MSLGRGRGPRRDDEWCLVIPSSWEPAPITLVTTSALSRQPLAQVLRNITDPRDRRGVRHSLFTVLSLAVTGVLAGCRSLTAIWEHTTDLTPSDLRSLGLEAGQALPSAVIHPAGAAGPGPHRPQHPSEVVVVHSYRRRRGKNGHCGGRVRPCAQPAWGRPRRRTSCRPWTTPRAPC